MNKIYYLPVLLSVVSLSGCAGLISQPADNVPIEEPGTSETQVSSRPNPTSGNVNKQFIGMESMQADLYEQESGPVSQQSVIIALLNDANQQQLQGQVTIAAATIERAIRLEPNNPQLWTRLAQIRLVEMNWQQAYVLANKSNSLARENKDLQRQNWGIIEVAKTRQGDLVSAEFARAQIRKLVAE